MRKNPTASAKWVGHVSCMEEERIVLSVLVGGPEKKGESFECLGVVFSIRLNAS